MRVHSVLGPGLLESAYEECLAYELRSDGLSVEKQVPLAIVYKQVRIDVGYRIDLLVEKAVVVELKSVARIEPIHKAQVLSYVKLGGFLVGLLINFNVIHLREGINRLYPGTKAADPEEQE